MYAITLSSLQAKTLTLKCTCHILHVQCHVHELVRKTLPTCIVYSVHVHVHVYIHVYYKYSALKRFIGGRPIFVLTCMYNHRPTCSTV